MADELITIEEARRHLRIRSPRFDDEVLQALQAAREFCETHTGRTLRPSTTRTLTIDDWWIGQLAFPNPPLLGVTEINYWIDGDDTELDSDNYQVVLSTESVGWIEWTVDGTQPSLDTRPDAVRITYTAGYTELPAKAKYAILMMLTYFWGDGKGRDLDYAERAGKQLLVSCDWGSYA